jgi:hypothetical protein
MKSHILKIDDELNEIIKIANVDTDLTIVQLCELSIFVYLTEKKLIVSVEEVEQLASDQKVVESYTDWLEKRDAILTPVVVFK